MSSRVQFFFQDVQPTLTRRTELKSFLTKLLVRHGRQVQSLNYIFCTDKALRKINKEHLRHDYFTDIITFDLSTDWKKLEAEIYISIERVRLNAKDYQTTLKNELHRVIFHGALHLCGYSDKNPAKTKEMRDMEEKCLKAYFG